MPFRIQHVDHVAVTVADIARSTAWYRDVLGLERRHQEVWDVPAMLCAGETCLALFSSSQGNPLSPVGSDTIGLRHIAFRVDRASFDELRESLPSMGIPVEFQDHGISHSIYLHDPDGHRIELTTYELAG